MSIAVPGAPGVSGATLSILPRGRRSGVHPIHRAIRVAGMVAISSGAFVSHAQAPSSATGGVVPSQVLPPSLRPAEPMAIPLAMPTEPSDVELIDDRSVSGPRVLLAGAIVDGGFPELVDAAHYIDLALQAKQASWRDMQSAALLLERRYAAAGFPLVRVAVPPQRLTDGSRLTLRVIDGFVEGIVVDGVDEHMRAVVLGRVRSLVGRHRLRVEDLERTVLLAGELSGLQLRSALLRGQQEGGALLVLEGRYRAGEARLQIDNALPSAMGRWEASGTVVLDSPTGRGDQWYAVATSSVASQALRSIGLGNSVPVMTSGAGVIGFEFAHAVTRPRSGAGTLATAGFYDRWSQHATYALVREPEARVDIEVLADEVRQRLEASDFHVDLNHDDYAALRLQASGALTLPRATSLRFSLSLDRGLSGRSVDDGVAAGTPTSRLGVGAHFGKLRFGLDIARPEPGDWTVELHAAGQMTAAPLLVSEQLSFAGLDALSAFDSGTLSVDAGLSARVQVGRNLPMTAKDSLAAWRAYVFAALGHGHLFSAMTTPASSLDAAADGAGLRATWPLGAARSMSFGIEAAIGRASAVAGVSQRDSRVGTHLEAHW